MWGSLSRFCPAFGCTEIGLLQKHDVNSRLKPLSRWKAPDLDHSLVGLGKAQLREFRKDMIRFFEANTFAHARSSWRIRYGWAIRPHRSGMQLEAIKIEEEVSRHGIHFEARPLERELKGGTGRLVLCRSRRITIYFRVPLRRHV